jgi:hypothetical protein
LKIHHYIIFVFKKQKKGPKNHNNQPIATCLVTALCNGYRV